MLNQFFGEESGKKVSKWATSVLFFLSIFLFVKTVAELKDLPNIGRDIYPQSTIQVSGEGEAFAIPDIASFNFTVTEVANTVALAQEALDRKISNALEILENADVEEKDIKTVNYNVYPKYEWRQVACVTFPCPPGKNELVGYEVSQTISIKVRKTEKAGELVNQIGAVDVSNISGVQFTVDDEDTYIEQAREMAINDAKEKAKILADQLGVRLGKILYYNEGSNYPVYYGEEAYGKGGAMDLAVSSVTPARAELPEGETKITSQVTITYEIK